MDKNDEVKTIFHSGVLGMKWGRRRGPGTDTASDGVRLKGPNGKPLIVSKETRDAKGNLVVQYGGKKTSAVKDFIKSKTTFKSVVSNLIPAVKALNKIEEYAKNIKASDKPKQAHNDKVSKRLDEIGAKYDKIHDPALDSTISGEQKAKFGMTAAERAVGKAQVRAGQKAIDDAMKVMDKEYADVPPYQVTSGIAVTRAIVATGIGAMVYMAYLGAGH